MFVYMAVRGKLRRTWAVLRSRTGLFIVLAAVIGAPIGMTGYMTAINNIGASYTAAISAFFPAFGALLSHLFLKERMKGYQWVGLMACLVGVAALGWTPAENIPGDWFLGVAGALVCVVGWGTEAVIIAYGLRDESVDDENALQIRQTTSALSYALVILPLLGGWAPAAHAFASDAMPIIAAAAPSGNGVVPVLLQGHRPHRRGEVHGAQHHVLRLGHPLLAAAAGHHARRARRGVRHRHHRRRHHGLDRLQGAVLARQGRGRGRPR